MYYHVGSVRNTKLNCPKCLMVIIFQIKVTSAQEFQSVMFKIFTYPRDIVRLRPYWLGFNWRVEFFPGHHFLKETDKLEKVQRGRTNIIKGLENQPCEGRL